MHVSWTEIVKSHFCSCTLTLTEFMATVLVQQNLAEKPLYRNYGKAHLNAEVKILATQDLGKNVCRGKDTHSIRMNDFSILKI